MNKNYKIEITVTDEETGNTLKGQTNTNLLQDLSNITIMQPKDIVWNILDPILKEFQKYELP
jgi:hypothetical protein